GQPQGAGAAEGGRDQGGGQRVEGEARDAEAQRPRGAGRGLRRGRYRLRRGRHRGRGGHPRGPGGPARRRRGPVARPGRALRRRPSGTPPGRSRRHDTSDCCTGHTPILAVVPNAAGELTNASVAIVDEDHSDASRRIRDALQTPFVKPAVDLSVEEVEPSMDTGRFTFVINIPPNFEADLMRGRSAPIQLNVDATVTSQVTTGVRYILYVINEEVSTLRGYPEGPTPDVNLV